MPRPPSRLTANCSLTRWNDHVSQKQSAQLSEASNGPAAKLPALADALGTLRLMREQDHLDELSIKELYDEVAATLAAAFPRSRPLWVRGEIQKISESSGHAYIDVIDSEQSGERGAPTLKVKCWRSTWGPLKASLADDGIPLAAGMTVLMRGAIDFYAPRAEVGFILAEISKEDLLGRLARARAELIEQLETEGLMRAQQRLVVPEVPLSIGLVGSPGTEGFNDFFGQLDRSGFSFSVTVARATVQGPSAPAEVAAAISGLSRSGVGLICVIRGGGSKGDLAAFDSPEVARAIATCSVPVWTGIGHTGDESVADLVANVRHITPTACGVAIVERVGEFDATVRWAAGRIAQRAAAVCEVRAAAYRTIRIQLIAGARGHVNHHRHELERRRSSLQLLPGSSLGRATSLLRSIVVRIEPLVRTHLSRAADDLAGRRQLLDAYDPVRLLERGWSITTDANGRVLRSVGEALPGATISTRLKDGSITSTVDQRRGREEER